MSGTRTQIQPAQVSATPVTARVVRPTSRLGQRRAPSPAGCGAAVALQAGGLRAQVRWRGDDGSAACIRALVAGQAATLSWSSSRGGGLCPDGVICPPRPRARPRPRGCSHVSASSAAHGGVRRRAWKAVVAAAGRVVRVHLPDVEQRHTATRRPDSNAVMRLVARSGAPRPSGHHGARLATAIDITQYAYLVSNSWQALAVRGSTARSLRSPHDHVGCIGGARVGLTARFARAMTLVERRANRGGTRPARPSGTTAFSPTEFDIAPTATTTTVALARGPRRSTQEYVASPAQRPPRGGHAAH
jgi:hypothetical protein